MGADETSGKLIERSTYMLVIVVRKKASTYSTSGIPTIGVMPAQNACGSKEVGPPFPVSPAGGKPGRAGSPHAAGTPCASKQRWHTSMPRLPPQEGFQSASLKPPLRNPPDGHRGGVVMVSLDLWAGEKIKDGRHVGLDFLRPSHRSTLSESETPRVVAGKK